jgi:hypothetical protein
MLVFNFHGITESIICYPADKNVHQRAALGARYLFAVVGGRG